jgi:hypothetical protein
LEVVAVTFVLVEGGVVVSGQAIAHEDAGVIAGEDLVEDLSPPRVGGHVVGEVGCGDDPEPGGLAYPPTRFVDVSRGGVAELFGERVVLGFEFGRHSLERLGESAGSDGESEEVFEDGAGLADRKPVVLVQFRGDGQSPRAEVGPGRARRGGNFERMVGFKLRITLGATGLVRDEFDDYGFRLGYFEHVLNELRLLLERGRTAVRTPLQWDFFVNVHELGRAAVRAGMAFGAAGLLRILFPFLFRAAKRGRLTFGLSLGLLELFFEFGDLLILLPNRLQTGFAFGPQGLIFTFELGDPLGLTLARLQEPRRIVPAGFHKFESEGY